MRRFGSKTFSDDRSANLLAANPRLLLLSVSGGAVALIALLSVAVLASVPPPPIDCFDSRPAASQATPEERLALADARMRERENCQAPWRQCAFDVATSHDSIHVFVERADVAADGCRYLPDDHAGHSYDLRGTFQSTGLSL